MYYDEANGKRHEVPGATYPTSGILIAGDKINVTLVAPSSPAPSMPGKYILVFQGQIGEDDGVAAMVFTAKPPLIERISVGLGHICGIRSNGTVTCWRKDPNWYFNYWGEATPLADTFRQVSAGAMFTCGVPSNGTVACWGGYSDGSFWHTGTLSQPKGTFLQVRVAHGHACGVRSNGTLTCWFFGGINSAYNIPMNGALLQVGRFSTRLRNS